MTLFKAQYVREKLHLLLDGVVVMGEPELGQEDHVVAESAKLHLYCVTASPDMS